MSSDKPNIRGVTFDLWATLLFERNGADSRRILARCKNLARSLNESGTEISVEKINSAVNAMVPWLTNIWETNQDVTHLEQLKFIVKTASKGLVTIRKEWINKLSSAYVSPLFEIPPFLEPNILKVLQWLKDRNISIGLICNTGLTPGFGLREFLENESIAEFFDLMLFSGEIGIRKPDPRIFQIAAKKMNVKIYEIIHVGDNLKTDVWGAKKAGLKAIHFSTNIGKDKIAEKDPNSLVTFSRKLGNLKEKDIIPYETITSLDKLVEIIENLNQKR